MGSAGKILVVEDDDLFATMMAERLGKYGHEITSVGDLASAVQALGRQSFDVVVADLHLPGNDDGLPDALLAETGNTPVILITGSPTVDSAVRSVESNVFAYRVKPFEMSAFAATVDQAIAHGRLQTRLEDSQRRYQALDQQLEALRQVATARAHKDINQSLADYLRLLLGSSGSALAEAIEVLAVLEKDRLAEPVRHLSRHPEAELFRAALEEAVEVLEKTRNSFKSKELADLRRRLERALRLAGEEHGSEDGLSPPLHRGTKSP